MDDGEPQMGKDEDTLLQQSEKVYRHWFLLEDDYVTAIQNGNLSLLPGAIERVDYRLKVVPKNLLSESLKGEEDALWELHRFLFNNGWWERARNLKLKDSDSHASDWQTDPLSQFLRAHEHLIHPNSRNLAFNGDREGIRMALNQIHYGSLQGVSKGAGQTQIRKHKAHEADEGWWKAGPYKPSNQESILLDFLLAHRDLIHPNSRSLALAGDPEGIRMALHQIHFGSLEERKRASSKHNFATETSKSIPTQHSSVFREFIQGKAHLIESSVLRDALQGDDKALSLALGQIHHHSLDSKLQAKSPPLGSDSSSYREALLKEGAKKPVQRSRKGVFNQAPKTHKKVHSVFFSGIQDSDHPKNLWLFFKKAGKIKDLILPKKKDKNGNRYGFIIMENEEEVSSIISKLSGKFFGSARLRLAKAKDRFVNPSVASPKRHKQSTPLESTPALAKKQVPTFSDFTIYDTSKPHDTPEDARAEVPKTDNEQPTDEDSGSEVLIEPSEEMLKIISQSLLLCTIRNETVQNVTMIAEGLGARNVQIRGISGTSFIAFFANTDDLRGIDKEFLKIGFADVREPTVDDFLPTRKAWVEIRGLPIVGWTEENLVNLLKNHGSILNFGATFDSENFYQHPCFQVETRQIDNILSYKKVKLMGKTWRVKIMESSGVNFQFNDVNSTCSDESDYSAMRGQSPPIKLPMGIPNQQQEVLFEDHLSIAEGIQTCDGPEKIQIPTTGKLGEDIDITQEENSPKSLEVSTQSEVNPLTPKCSPELATMKCFAASTASTFQEEIQMNTSHWMPRDPNPESPRFTNNTDYDASSPLVQSTNNSDMEHDELQQSLLRDLEKLKIKSKRGRPRKFKQNPINRSFRLPRRRKSKGEGLQYIRPPFLNNPLDEAEAIFETGVLMGLLPIFSKSESLDLIQKNLEC